MSLFDGQPIIPGDGIDRAAVLSECRRYRYSLTRRWDPRAEVVFICLNPSTADASKDDPTCRKLITFAKAWGYGSLKIVNLFAFRSPYPKALAEADDPVGPRNDAAIREACDLALLVVAAWGVGELAVERAAHVRTMLADVCELHYLRLNEHGRPWHPLYLPGDLRPTRWAP